MSSSSPACYCPEGTVLGNILLAYLTLMTPSSSCRIFSDVAGDIAIAVDGESFLLHKLLNFPGGPQTFELAMKFCYGINFEITTANVAPLRCAAEYLEMSEDYREENLIARTEVYLNEAIAMYACKEQMVSGLSRLDCDGESTELKSGLEWWIEDLSVLRVDYYQKIICAMGRIGVRPDSIVESLMHYAQASLNGIGKCQIWNPVRMKPNPGVAESDQKTIVEILVNLLPTEKSSSVPLIFLFGMLRMTIMLEATIACRLELERRIAIRLEMCSLDDLLIPSLHTRDFLFDVDTVHRILVKFLQRIEDEENEDCRYVSDGLGSLGHGSLLKVGRLIDTYLAEIASDPYLSLPKFIAMIGILPDYARVIDDGLYRAIDIYLKAHPILSDHECKKLCKFMDCQKLSQEASNHAAQNERLPVQMAVRVLYFEQLRLKNALSGSSGDEFLS
ncbi:hypothetical protein CRYUN_Cryun21dG0126000 [Craigia yunnanensis]